MTPLAHAVRFAMRCGITTVAELANELECTPSAVYRAMKQLNASDRTVKSDRTELTERSQTDRTVTPSDQPVTKTDRTVTNPQSDEPRAYIESPSEIVIQLVASSEQPSDEIKGLNGSTTRLVKQLAGWLNQLMPDEAAARSILVGSVDAYGADRVRAGMLELETAIAAGEKPRNLAKTFAGYIKSATLPPAPGDEAKSKNDRALRELEAIAGSYVQ